MRNSPLLIAIVLLVSLCVCPGESRAQDTTFTIGSNLDPVLVADAGHADTVVFPQNVWQTIPMGGSPAASGGDGNFTYSWTPAGGFDAPSTANPNYDVDSTELFVVLTVTDGKGCTTSDTVFFDFSLPSAEEQLTEIRIEIFPNPNDGDFTLIMNGKPTGKPLEIIVRDALGRIVFHELTAGFSGSAEREIRLGDLGKGVYFFGLRSEGKEAVRKLIVQ